MIDLMWAVVMITVMMTIVGRFAERPWPFWVGAWTWCPALIIAIMAGPREVLGWEVAGIAWLGMLIIASAHAYPVTVGGRRKRGWRE